MFSARMKRLLYARKHLISGQINTSSNHSEPNIIQNIRNCKDFISATSKHSCLLKSGLLNNTIIANHLINCYKRLLNIRYAHLLFDEMPAPNVVSFTALMAGYVEMGQTKFALGLYKMMPASLVMPNGFTFATMISACSMLSDVETGKKIHAHVEIFGFQRNLVACSALVDMYGKCNDVDGARRVFDSMEFKNVVSWTSMIAAYAQNARGNEALEVFRKFKSSTEERTNHFMLASVINACASMGKLISGKVAHAAVLRSGYEGNDVVASALVDMYAKCGCFGYSNKVFRLILNPSVIPYTSMIVGAAKHGLGKVSLQLFEEMVEKRIKPTDVTFVGVLHACSHSGLVSEGLQHLNSMYRKHGVIPDMRHYTCVVDILSRSGRLDEAYQLANSVTGNPNEGALLWGTLLSASRLLGRLDIAVEASKRLIESNNQVSGAYVTMANAYASAGEWESAHNVRSELKRIRVYKEPGCSWVEIKDSTHVFYSGKVPSERGKEVVDLVKELERRMKERGYVGGSMEVVFVEVEQEAREEIVSLHSERLALAFGLLSLPKGITIRIMKNLRMCRDCHEAFKLISGIVEREFVVRDVTRFHHFKNGYCSCKDFW